MQLYSFAHAPIAQNLQNAHIHAFLNHIAVHPSDPKNNQKMLPELIYKHFGGHLMKVALDSLKWTVFVIFLIELILIT